MPHAALKTVSAPYVGLHLSADAPQSLYVDLSRWLMLSMSRVPLLSNFFLHTFSFPISENQFLLSNCSGKTQQNRLTLSRLSSSCWHVVMSVSSKVQPSIIWSCLPTALSPSCREPQDTEASSLSPNQPDDSTVFPVLPLTSVSSQSVPFSPHLLMLTHFSGLWDKHPKVHFSVHQLSLLPSTYC